VNTNTFNNYFSTRSIKVFNINFVIISIVEYYQTHKDINHAPIRICFTPDEEIGAGADHFSTTKMDADVA